MGSRTGEGLSIVLVEQNIKLALGLDRFFAKAQELGIVIFMHPIGFTQGERLRDHYFNNVIGNPLETTVAASHLIFDGVMERYSIFRPLIYRDCLSTR